MTLAMLCPIIGGMSKKDQIVGSVSVTESEAVFLRMALQEFRTAAPLHIVNDENSLSEWRKDREMWEPQRTRLMSNVTDILENCFDQNIRDKNGGQMPLNIDYRDYECDTLKFIKGDGIIKTLPVGVDNSIGASTGDFEQIPLDQLETLGEQCARAIFGLQEENK